MISLLSIFHSKNRRTQLAILFKIPQFSIFFLFISLFYKFTQSSLFKYPQMQNKPYTKRLEISFKKAQPFNLTKNTHGPRQNHQQKLNQNLSSQFSTIKDEQKKPQTARSKITCKRKRELNPWLDQNSAQKKASIPKNIKKFSKVRPNTSITECDQKINRLVQQITPKAKGFYRFGMKSYQKSQHKRLYSEIMNIPLERTNGVMYVGELWTNEMANKFLKLNKMSMNKLKFFEKLRQLKQDQIAKERELDSSSLISSVRDFSKKTLKHFETIPRFESLLSLNRLKQASDEEKENLYKQKGTQKTLRLQKYQKNSHEYKQVLSAIKKTINQETIRCKSQNYWKDMKELQSQSHQMHKLWDKYFAKMLQIS